MGRNGRLWLPPAGSWSTGRFAGAAALTFWYLFLPPCQAPPPPAPAAPGVCWGQGMEIPVLGSDSAPAGWHSLAWTLSQPEELLGTEVLVPFLLQALCHRLGLHGQVLPGAVQPGRGEGSCLGHPLPTVGAPMGPPA